MQPPPRTVPRNDWRAASPRGLGSPSANPQRVSVVVPAHNCQDELELTCAALAAQSHPSDLLELIIVDDRSEPALMVPLVSPENTRIIRADGSGHGSGRARDLGAAEATGDVLLFLDADIITDRCHVEAHVRWHEVIGDAIVLGTRDFVETSGLSARDVYLHVSGSDLAGLIAGRPTEPHAWIESYWAKTDDLAVDREDLWRPVVGASVSVSRALYDASGGFAHFTRRGVVDTEFGYRCFTAGAVVVPERAAHSIHQGQRTFSTQRDRINRERMPLMSNLVANRRYRSTASGRQYAVPYLNVVISAEGVDFADVAATVDDLLANRFDDLRIVVVTGPDHPDQPLLQDSWGSDGRVRFTETRPASGFPSPATMAVPSGSRFTDDAVAALVKRLQVWSVGLLSVSAAGVDGAVEVWATRALLRSLRDVGPDGDLRSTARQLFGEEWLAGADVGVTANPTTG